MGRRQVFVVAVMGEAPGVITELLWHLVRREHAHVCGLEIWTTAGDGRSGETALRKKRGLFETLHTELGSESDHAPTLPEPLVVDPPPTAPWDGRRFRLIAFGHGEPLADIRHVEDAGVVERQMYDRVRTLRKLAQEIQLVGSIAGGRKTMSTALYTAFALHARAGDRLVHVLVHPTIEGDNLIRERFACPVEGLGIPLDEQISVHDAPFPRIRAFVHAHDNLIENLDDLGHHDLWEGLRAIESVEQAILRKRKDRESWHLELHTREAGEPLRAIRLTPEQGRLYQVLIDFPGGATEEELGLRTEEARRWRDKPGRQAETIRKALQSLQKRLADHAIGRALRDLVPMERDGRWKIPAAATGRVRAAESETVAPTI